MKDELTDVYIAEFHLYNDSIYNSKLPMSSYQVIARIPGIPDLIGYLNENNFLYAYICHDKDVGVKPHYHVICKKKDGSRFSARQIQRNFGIRNPDVKIKDDWEQSVLYLAHRSKQAIKDSNKYKYSPDEIISNFEHLDIFASNKDGLDEWLVVEQILDHAKECGYNWRKIGHYAGSIGHWAYFKKNIQYIRLVVEEEKKDNGTVFIPY